MLFLLCLFLSNRHHKKCRVLFIVYFVVSENIINNFIITFFVRYDIDFILLFNTEIKLLDFRTPYKAINF